MPLGQRNVAGFSLMEITIVLLVLSIISVSGLSLYQDQDTRSKTRVTQDRMAAIEEALQNYRYIHNSLPCPADARLGNAAANFARAGLYAGECDDITFGATAVTGGTAIGAVPTRTLNLTDDHLYDAWGRRFTYMVDARITETNAMFAYLPDSAVIGNIQVNDASGTAITNSALYALISHGVNGHGAYLSSGMRKNAKSENADELTNAKLDASFNDSFNNVVVARRQTENDTNFYNAYDDIVHYKERWAMATIIDKKIIEPVVVVPSDPCLVGCTPGAVMADGSVCAGVSPDGNLPMCTTPSDAFSKYHYNNTNFPSADAGMDKCTSSLASTSCITGAANTEYLALHTGIDAPYEAAVYCYNLDVYGHQDWYLPAMKEFEVMLNNYVAIGNFNDDPTTWNESVYIASSEGSDARYWRGWRIKDAIQGNWHKEHFFRVRCVRKAAAAP